MGMQDEIKEQQRKRTIRIAFRIFIGILLFFTIFSNTLESLTLPKVTTELLRFGSIEHSLEGSGVLRPIEEVKLSNAVDWKVEAIHVKEGVRVKKGQKLITYDSSSIERELLDEEAELAKMKIAIQNNQEQFIQATRDEDELEVRRITREIKTMELNTDIQQRRINEKRNDLSQHKAIVAPFDGIITKINAVDGKASMGEPDILLSDSRFGYQFDFGVDASLVSSLAMKQNDQIQVDVTTIENGKTTTVEGTIASISLAGSRTENLETDAAESSVSIEKKVIQVHVKNAALKGGEQATVKLKKRSKHEGLLVLDKAIHHDHEGEFLYKVEIQSGPLGNEFIVRKVRVDMIEKSGNVTMIQSNNVTDEDRIILESSEPLQDNNRVRLE